MRIQSGMGGTLVLCLCGLVPSASVSAEERPADLARLSRVVDGAEDTRGGRMTAGETVLAALRTGGAEDAETARLAGMLDLSLGRERFVDAPLGAAIEAAAKADDPGARAWNEVIDRVFDRVDHLLSSNHEAALTEADTAVLQRLVDRLTERAKQGTEAERARLATTIDRLTQLAGDLQLPESGPLRDRLEVFRRTVGTLASTWRRTRPPVTPFEIPSAVTAGLIDHNRRGLEAITTVMDGLPAAMSGDPQAIRNLLQASRRVEDVLTGRRYARAIWEAFNDRVARRFPFARTLAEWFGLLPNEQRLARWTGAWTTTWTDLEIAPNGVVTPTRGLFARRGGRIVIRYSDVDTVGGDWDFRVIGIRGTFEWTLGRRDSFTGHRTETGHAPLRWNGERS